MSPETTIKESQRVSRTCVECGRRKIKCDKRVPCAPCIRRNLAHECKRPITRVRGQLQVGSEVVESPDYQDADDAVNVLLKERSALRSQIAQLEIALALSKPSTAREIRTTESPAQTDFDDLIPQFEQFDLDVHFDSSTNPALQQLWAPANDPLYMLLPTREASRDLVVFALTTFGWLHCAVRADVFLEQHDDFWDHLEAGSTVTEEQRAWLALWLSLLSVALMYMDADQIPSHEQLPRNIFSDAEDDYKYALDISRMWYESALQELHRSGAFRKPTLESVQSILVLTQCNSNNGEHQQEWVLLGACINMARSLDMHRLGSEQSFQSHIASRPEWSTAAGRELGRRLWWNIVICDWLGPWNRPPSISPATFCCSISGHGRFDYEVMPSVQQPASKSSPSPVQYLTVMARLAYIFYIYLKANATRTAMKTSKALDEIEAIRRSLPLHLSPHFPANQDDVNWESTHPWVTFQRYQISVVLDFMVLSIARSLAVAKSVSDRQKYRSLAQTAARSLLINFTTAKSRTYKLLWSSSASAVAAGVFLMLDYLLPEHNKTAQGSQIFTELLPTLQNTIEILRHNSMVTVHAENGAAVLAELCNICLDWPNRIVGKEPPSIHSILEHVKAKASETEGPDLNHAGLIFEDMLVTWPLDSGSMSTPGLDFNINFDFDASMSLGKSDGNLSFH